MTPWPIMMAWIFADKTSGKECHDAITFLDLMKHSILDEQTSSTKNTHKSIKVNECKYNKFDFHNDERTKKTCIIVLTSQFGGKLKSNSQIRLL